MQLSLLSRLAIASAIAAPWSGLMAQDPILPQHGTISPEPAYQPGPNVPQPPRGLQQGPHKHGMPAVPIGQGTVPQTEDPPVAIAAVGAELAGDYRAFRNVTVKPGGASSSRISEPACTFADDANGFFTANWYAARSSDGGASWSYENPYTKFAASFGGFCCDQRLITSKNGQTTVWMLQYVKDGAGNGGTRLAVATSPSNLGAGTFSHSYMFTPPSFGFPGGTWLDFPDCAASDDHFYFASNVFDASSQFVGAVVWRIAIAQMQAGGNIGFSYVTSAAISGASYRFTQHAGDRMYWARHESTTALRIHWWDDAGGGIGSRTQAVSQWSGSYAAAPGPDGRDWTGRADSRITGGYQSLEEFGWVWHSGPVGGRTNNHLRVVRFNLADGALLDERNLFNNTVSLMYPAASTNAAGHVAIVSALGGGTFHPAPQVILRDEVENYGSLRLFAGGDSGPTSNVWGDYFTMQRRPGFRSENTWVATGMAMNGGGGNANQNPRMIHFGREAYEPGFVGLTVRSAGVGGVPITVTPNDRFAENNGSTPFLRSYAPGTGYSVTAPLTHTAGSTTYVFERWATKAVPGTTSWSLQAPGQNVFTISSIGSQADTVEARYVVGFQADATRYGTGCPTPPVFYEQFVAAGNPADLSGFAFLMQANAAGGWTVTAATGTRIDTSFSNNLNLSDDQLAAGNPLGFVLPLPGAGSSSTIDIDSNGRVGFGLTRSDFSESVAELVADNILAVLWDDLNPSVGGGVYFDQRRGYAMVTWDNVPEFGTTNANTFQLKIFPSGQILVVYGQIASLDHIAGYSPGGASDPGPRDLSASLPFYTGNGTPLGLAASARPLAGTTIQLQTSSLPPNGLFGAVLVGFSNPNLPLAAIGMGGCTLYSAGNLTSLPIAVANPNTPLPITTDANVFGLSLYLQSAIIAPSTNALGVVVSNGLQLTIGNY
jgi:hypothetical protein